MRNPAVSISVPIDGETKTFPTGTCEEKGAAYHEIYWWLRGLPEDRARTIVRNLADTAGVDPQGLCRSLVMDWDELRELADDPLVTIGAHTCSHRALSKLSDDEALSEMADSIARIEDELATPCHHFSYPYGGPEACGEREYELARIGSAS